MCSQLTVVGFQFQIPRQEQQEFLDSIMPLLLAAEAVQFLNDVIHGGIAHAQLRHPESLKFLIAT